MAFLPSEVDAGINNGYECDMNYVFRWIHQHKLASTEDVSNFLLYRVFPGKRRVRFHK